MCSLALWHPEPLRLVDSVSAASWHLWGGGQHMDITPVLISLAERDRSSCAVTPHQYCWDI